MTKPPPPTLPELKASGVRWGLDEFVEVVNSHMERYLPTSRPPNAKLRDAFNPRLVRYYATIGLIAPPEREGKEARYHHGHLIQALMIRRLLFEGYTAPALLKMLAGKTGDDYEAMLAAAGDPSAESSSDRAVAPTSEHSGLVRELMAAAPPLRTVASAPPPPSAPPAHLWRRVDVAPGLELQVRADFELPENRIRRESLLLAIIDALSRK